MTIFCSKCGSLMVAKKEGNKVVMVCPRCGHTVKKEEKIEIKEKVKEKKEIIVIDKDINSLPVVNAICRKCGNDKAYFWSVQTRASDEPETRFYKCRKCGFVWREYE